MARFGKTTTELEEREYILSSDYIKISTIEDYDPVSKKISFNNIQNGINSNLSSNWATFPLVSAKYESVYSTVNSNSAGWENIESVVNSNSAIWSGNLSGITWGIIQGSLSAQTDLQNELNLKSNTNHIHQQYESVYTTTNTHSAGWENVESVVTSNSANWKNNLNNIYYTSINETLSSNNSYDTIIQLSASITTTLWNNPISGQIITIKNNSDLNTFVSGNNNYIESSFSRELNKGESITLIYDNSKWLIKNMGFTELSIEQWVNPVPTSSTSNGHKGQFAVDQDFFYICIAENQWVQLVSIRNF